MAASAGRRMRTLLHEKKFVVTPGVATALQAMIVEKVGFDFIYVGGYDTALMLLGMPDVGLMTGTEMLANARNVARAVSLPVLADVDTGYGNAINVMRTVRDFEEAGLAAVHIEDQTFPKRCGHVAGKTVVPLEEAVGKLRAAMDARSDPDFMIFARTDAVAAVGGGLQEAVRRGKAFADAGCDVVWCEFPTSDPLYAKAFAGEMRRHAPRVPLYLDYSGNLDWQATGATFDDFAEMGYRIMHVSLAGLRVAIESTWNYLTELSARGARAEMDFSDSMAQHPMRDFHRTGLEEAQAARAKYGPERRGD